MVYAFPILFFLLALWFVYNLWQIYLLSKRHYQTIEHLKNVVVKLSDRQHALSEKITVANQFKSHFAEDTKVLNREIAEFQYLLFDLISGSEQKKD